MTRRAPLMMNYSLWEFGVYRWSGALAAAVDDVATRASQEISALDSVAAIEKPTIYPPIVAR